MGVSFKVSKVGKRYQPKPNTHSSQSVSESGENPGNSFRPPEETPPKAEVNALAKTILNGSSVSSSIKGQHIPPEHEVSFTLNLFPDGFFIGKPNEATTMHNLLQDGRSLLYPYNRASEALFSAVESGWLPGDVFDDMPCKYVNGTLVCEVRDYRKFSTLTEVGSKTSSDDAGPIVNKVLLRMSLENIVKDMPSISDDSWTYGDLMEVESRVLKALRPQLCLDPTPMLNQLPSIPCENKLNLGISKYKRRLQSATEVTIESNNQLRGKKVCIDRKTDTNNSDLEDIRIKSGDAAAQHYHRSRMTSPVSNNHLKTMQGAGAQALELANQSPYEAAESNTRTNQNEAPVSYVIQGVNARVQPALHLAGPQSDSLGSNVLPGKREGQDMQATNSKKMKLVNGQDSNQQLGSPHGGAEMHWKNPQLPQQLDVKGGAYNNIPSQKYHTMSNSEPGSFYLNNLGNRIIKQEQADLEKLRMNPQGSNQLSQQQLQQTQLAHHSVPSFQQQQWNTVGSPAEDMWKKAPAQNPQFSSGTSVHSPVSSQSVEVSNVSVLGSQKEKTMSIGGAPAGSSVQKNLAAGKRKPSSISNTHGMSGVASPASVGNASTPLTANSPVVPPTSVVASDPVMLERFSKLNMISQRYQLHKKRNKIESFNAIKPKIHSSNEIASCLANLNVEDNVEDPDRPMSRSILDGSVNNCKIRSLSCIRSAIYQGSVLYRFKIELMMRENPVDGSVVAEYSSKDELDAPLYECMLTLPNTNHADLLGAQFRMLMDREGCQLFHDRTIPAASDMRPVSYASGVTGNITAQEGQIADGLAGQQSNPALLGINSSMGGLNSQSVSNNTRMVPGNAHATHMPPQGYLPSGQTPTIPRAQQFDQSQQALLLQQQQNQSSQQMLTQLQQQMQPQLHQQQQQQVANQPQQAQQQQHPQIQRSSVLQINPLSQIMGQNPNMQMGGNQMINKPTHVQLQAMQQQTSQQQAQFARKNMMGLGGVSVSNAMMGLGNFSSVMGGVRGMPSPMGTIPGFNNINQNQINLGPTGNYNVGFRPGSASHAAALRQLRMTAPTQARGNLFGSQSGIAGMPGNSTQMLSGSMGLSMLGQLNRPSLNPLQRNALQNMGPPKITGNNVYMNPQQLQQQQLQQQQTEQQDQQLQNPQQQQQISSPLLQPQQQQASSPSVMGSPPMQMQQQQMNPVQMNQQTPISPQQLSTGALPQVNNSSLAGTGPASPQLSSQTHGSVGSICSSPMEQLQSANKGS